MRTLGTALAASVLLSFGAAADEPSAAVSPSVTSEAEASQPIRYPLEWQRRLLAAQLAFAATLQQVDQVETGAITPQAQ